MQLRVFTLRFDPATESFDDGPVTGFLADKEVLGIDDHFFVKDDVPYLALVVRYRTPALPAPADKPKAGKPRDESWRKKLTPTDWPLFNSLRDWRMERAKANGIPPYVICSNRQLAEVVKRRPATLSALGAIEGFGEATLRKYGKELLALEAELLAGVYRPGDFFTFEIRDPKRREICAAPFRDRVLHHALCNVVEPVFERRLIFDTYACRPGKGTHAALKRAQQFARRYPYFLKCDIRKYFQSVDHARLKALLGRLFEEPRLLALLYRIIDHAPPDAEPGRGLPIGNLTSQHFANLYLGELDHFLKEGLRVKGYLRYMDDLLLFAADKRTLYGWLAELRGFLDERLGLQLKEGATL